MKKIATYFFFLFCIIEVNAQSITVSLSIPATPFQDGDLGAMTFGDIDNDGDKDLIITGKGGTTPIKTTLYINDGLGNFIAATGTPFVNVWQGTVGFADLNNDGFLDLLITGATSSPTRTTTLYMNNTNGTFTNTSNSLTPSSSGDFDFADIDNDGDLDIILTGFDNNLVAFTRLYTNNGLGVFIEVATNPFQQLKNSSVAFIDIDNDNDKDIILAGKNEANVLFTKLYSNNGAGLFTEVANTTFSGINNGDVAVADSDNDGDLDIFITGSGDPSPISKLYTNNGTGTFTEVIGTPFIGAFANASVEFADFDNDGDKDILLVGAKTTSNPNAFAHIYENTGSNNFVLSNNLIATYQSSIAIADIDGDNDLDFIIAGTHFQGATHNPKLYKNNLFNLGNLSFDTSTNISIYPNPSNNSVNFSSSEIIESVTIYNLLGQEVFSKIINSNEFKLDISNQANGTYIAKINSNGKSELVKLVKL